MLLSLKNKLKKSNKKEKENKQTTNQTKAETTYNSPCLHRRWRYYQVIALNDLNALNVSPSYIPCPTVTIVKCCHTVMKTVRQYQEGGGWTST